MHHEIVRLSRQGYRASEIARQLGVSRQTVQNARRDVRRLYGTVR